MIGTDHAQILNSAPSPPDSRRPVHEKAPMHAVLAARRPATRPGTPAAAAVHAIGHLVFAALVAFHAWLLALHLVDGRALEPATAVRWLLAGLVLAGFRTLNQRGLPVFFGRRAVGLWLLVAIIHCSAAWDGGAAAALDRAIPESAAARTQLSVATLIAGTALAAVLSSAPGPWAGGRPAFAVPVLIAGLPATGFAFRFSPRPPPLD
jgi:hypothetical protein